jgi:hypothetical protein
VIVRRMMQGCAAPLLALAIAAAAPPSAAGQEAGARVPQARMNAFVRAIGVYPRDTLLAFFPRRGTWTWMLTTRRGDDATPGLWRFGPADLVRAIDHPGPLCETFSRGGDAMPFQSLRYQGRGEPHPWLRVGAFHFVPPGASSGSATFVRWRREDGRWVIDAIGGEVAARTRLLGRALTEVVRDLGGPPPADEGYAAGAAWYESNLPLVVGDERLDKYGLPRGIPADLLLRYGFVDGVAAYAEAGTEREKPSVLYVPVSTGMYQPYQFMTSTGCP